MTAADVRVTDHGSLLVVEGLTDAGQEWMDSNLPEDAMGWGQHGIVVEPRYVADIVQGMQDDGLAVV